MKFIPYGRHNITEEDIEAVVKVLKSDFLTQGPSVEKFENAICNYVNAKYAIACCNGTAALHLAAIAAGVTRKDRCIVPAITFAASANCISYCGGEILFADIDDTITISIDSCKSILEKNRKENKPIKVVVTVDMAGNKCDYKALNALRKEYGFVWISDACHRIVAEENIDGPDMTVYSFHPVKHMTTGEGGMIVTNSTEYATNMRLNRTHGITKDSNSFVNALEAKDANGLENPWYYEMQQLGFNYRITDIQAALGISQLKRLDAKIKRRQEIADIYKKQLAGLLNVGFPKLSAMGIHSYHLAVLLIDFDKLGKTRAEIMNELRMQNIGTQVHYIPVAMLPFYADKFDLKSLPCSFEYYKKTLTIPCFPTMTDEEIRWVCEHIKKICG